MKNNSKFTKLFDDETSLDVENNYMPVTKLKFSDKNKYKLYEGKRLEEMIRSVESVGIITPLIICLDEEDGLYEVIAGNNRLNVAKKLDLYEVPVVIKSDLTEDEKVILVTETNIQRSFDDMMYSERAVAIKDYYNAIKRQGKRKDLIDSDKEQEEVASATEKFSLGPTQIWKYTKFCNLIEQLQNLVDTKKLPFNIGVEIASLPVKWQELIFEVFENKELKQLSLKTIKELKGMEEGLNDAEFIERIKSAEKPQKKASTYYKLPNEILNKYIDINLSTKDKEEIIEEALSFYYENKK